MEAREYLNRPSPFDPGEYPHIDDVVGWQRWVEAREAPVRRMLAENPTTQSALCRESRSFSGVPTHVLRPPASVGLDDCPIFLEIHGGGFVMCGGDVAWQMVAGKAAGRAGETWVPDYRMPPLSPYPAALDDCVAVYRDALERQSPDRIIVSGTSAGGNLAAALLLRAKANGLPLPAALVLLTPQLDLTESGDSYQTNLGVDVISPLAPVNRLYANGHPLTHPFVSPLFGDFSGFPPTFLQSGTRDLFLSNVVRMHRKLLAANVSTELHIFEAMPHGSFSGSTPEDLELHEAIMRFENMHLPHKP